MKKLKFFMFVALFGAMSLGAFSTYEYTTMSEEERALLENVEALTSKETENQLGRLYYKGDNYYCCRLDTPDKPCGAAPCPPGTNYGD